MIACNLPSAQRIAGAAISPPRLSACILRRKRMSPLTVCARFASNRTCSRPRLKALGKDVPLGEGYFSKRCFAAQDSSFNGIGLNASHAGKLGEQIGFSFDLISDRNESIGLANLMRYPAAILRLVIPVIVDAIQNVIFWALPHIGKKVRKLVPARAYRNAASAIICPVRGLRIAASRAHSFPYCVKRMLSFEWHAASLVERQYHNIGS